ncbi:MAG: cell division protein FtsQ/DivIB [Pseudomonadota bacterium]
MARKQAKRRKPTTKRPLKLPTVRLGRVLKPLLAIAVVALVYEFSGLLLDRPVNELQIRGPMMRVSAVELEEAIEAELDRGFFAANLDSARDRIQSLQWIDQAAVARRWPDRIEIAVTEQAPAAIWGDSGLMNVRGELFVANGAEHLPADLPRLSGPVTRQNDVAERYLDMRQHLLPLGLDVSRVAVDGRGSWTIMLSNGVEIRMGRRDYEQRADLFVKVVAEIIAARSEDIAYVDVRYNNGFAIGWKAEQRDAVTDPENEARKLLAAGGAD